MRTAIIVSICAALVGTAAAQTITIETDPPGLDIYTLEGDFLGTAPVALQGPLEDNLTIVVKSKAGDFINVIDRAEERGDSTVVIAVPDKGKGFKAGSFGLGILAGIGIAFTVAFIVIISAWGAF